jgi:hypothetical protein
MRRMSVDVTAIPVEPPLEWFTPPAEIPVDKRVTIEDTGRVYGYIALWNACHVGMGDCVAPPQGSPSEYDLAHTGETMTAEGELIATANIGGGVGHFGEGTAQAAARYHGDTTSQLMRVRYGEDAKGLWFAGALWPDVTQLEVQRIRATSLSGDWRWVYGLRDGKSGMDFTGAVLVNIPGFPLQSTGGVSTEPGVLRNMVASLIPDTDQLFQVGCVECNPEGESMCDCKKSQPKTKRTVAAIVEPFSPEEVMNVIDEIVTVHAIATIEELLSILRPKAENGDVETSDIEPDEEAPTIDEEAIDAAAVMAAISDLKTDFANLKASVLAQSV